LVVGSFTGVAVLGVAVLTGVAVGFAGAGGLALVVGFGVLVGFGGKGAFGVFVGFFVGGAGGPRTSPPLVPAPA
jgi:hypothetical protein